MGKSNPKKFFKIAIFTLIISILLLFGLLILSINEINVQIGAPPNGIGHMTLSSLIIIVAVASLIYMLKDRVIKGVVIGLGAFFIIIPSLPNSLIEADYTRFSSPDNRVEFVVIERGNGRLYQLSNSGLYMTLLTGISTDDGYRPFSEGAYQLEWKEPHQLIVHYKFNYNSDSLGKEITTEYKDR